LKAHEKEHLEDIKEIIIFKSSSLIYILTFFSQFAFDFPFLISLFFIFHFLQIIFVAVSVNYATCRTAKDYREMPEAAARQSQAQFPSYNLHAPDGNAEEMKSLLNFFFLCC
jgi:hypothetical protein